jgi:hypothetical protein
LVLGEIFLFNIGYKVKMFGIRSLSWIYYKGIDESCISPGNNVLLSQQWEFFIAKNGDGKFAMLTNGNSGFLSGGPHRS